MFTTRKCVRSNHTLNNSLKTSLKTSLEDRKSIERATLDRLHKLEQENIRLKTDVSKLQIEMIILG